MLHIIFKYLSVFFILLIPSLVVSGTLYEKLKESIIDIGENVASDYISNQLGINKNSEYNKQIKDIKQEIEAIRTKEVNENDYNEILLLARNIEKLTENISSMNSRIDGIEKILLQQNEIIIKNNSENENSGENFIYYFYSLAKEVGVKQTYSMLSENAQEKLPYKDYSNWWNKTIDLVYVDEVINIEGYDYKVKISYWKKDGGYQCSEDILRLGILNGEWVIDDFLWGEC